MNGHSEPLLAVAKLSIDLRTAAGRRRVVDGVSFGLAPGEILALVGESGSGKSLTGLSLLGLLPPGARAFGSACFQAEAGAIDLLRAGERSLNQLRGDQIAWIPQEPLAAFDPRQTIGAQMQQALRAKLPLSFREAQHQLTALLREMALDDPERCLASYPFQLSGGMRQRVLIAMALSLRPRLLIADEPTTALDVCVQAQILARLGDWQSLLNLSILFITHDLAVAAGIAQRMAVFKEGRLVEEGPSASLLANPTHDYTRALVAAVPSLAPMPVVSATVRSTAG